MPKTHNLSEFSNFPTQPIHPFSFIKKLKKYSNSGAKKIDYEGCGTFLHHLQNRSLQLLFLSLYEGNFYEGIFLITNRGLI
jgi:hypothetical protein